MKRIMLVDDESNVLQALQRNLRKFAAEQNITLETHTLATDAIHRLGEASFIAVLSDFNMPQMSGVDFLKLAQAIQPSTVRLMLSASSDFKTLLGAINEAEVFRYIEKPWKPAELEEALRLAICHYQQSEQEHRLAEETLLQKGQLTQQEVEARRLESEEPGITHVNFGPDGSVLLE